MANIIADDCHILNQVAARYSATDSKNMLERVKRVLEGQAPEDWRFTESPSARFFVIDYPTKIKLLGLSYRDFGQGIIGEIQSHIEKNSAEVLVRLLPTFINQYIHGLYDPNISIIHQLRTAYPKTGGEIGEEKRIVSSIKGLLNHIIPIQEKKFSSRPNAIVMENDELWVRQHFNWIDLNNSNKEYFLFEQLTPRGINKSQRKIFSYSVNGDLRETTFFACPVNQIDCFPLLIKRDFLETSFRTDSYWMLPTLMDSRLMDLEFREREPEKADDGPLKRNELAELYFIRKIIEGARVMFKKT